ncbi:MAG: sigma-70 family RNA polymerase sigma factor [Verrucomicrobiota bacterium]
MRNPDSHSGGGRGWSGGAQFDQTQWSIVLAAAGKKDQALAERGLEKLCRIYWRPLYSYIRRQGENSHDAQDLTQEFFARLLEKDFLGSVDQTKGRFRSFLLAALRHFLSHQRDRARAQKRGGGQTPLSLDFSDAETGLGFQPADEQTPEKAFEKRWALTLLEQALARLRQEYSERGRLEIFEQLKTTLTEGRGGVAYAELAAGLGISEASVKMAVHRLRQRYRAVVRAEIAETVAQESEVEDELREVFRALSH